jgi:two-component system response regulator NreC
MSASSTAAPLLDRLTADDDGIGASDRTTVTVVLADDHRIVRRGLRMILEAEAGFEVVAEAGDVETATRKVLGYRPDILVLDLHMAGESSLAAIPRIREISPSTSIVVLTMDAEPAIARAALRAGAASYLLKDGADTELVAAVRLAAAGDTYLNPKLGAKIASLPEGPTRPPCGLTDRELSVLRLIALGYTNAEISVKLEISPRTVESHRAHIQQKTLRTARSELVAFAREHRIV